eukprot:GHVT01095747.1.p2 GENE.GHVT01095747.1~~GHVT01095747.1.p2  ORF type:complete len:164 (+),score=38.97 GHVT01095747.1:781-1272(+)
MRSGPFAAAGGPEGPPPAPSYAQARGLRPISRDELAKHNTAGDCWVVIHGVVYNLTSFLEDHPGGPEVLVSLAGGDASVGFDSIGHTQSAKKMAAAFEVGVLAGQELTATGAMALPPAGAAQDGSKPSLMSSVASWVPLALVVGAAVAALLIPRYLSGSGDSE